MERDFMGLTVKQEIPEEPTDPAVQSSTMRRSLSNKMSAPLHYHASTGPVIITSAETVDYSLKPYSGVPQKNMVLEKLGGIHYAHSVQHSFISPSGQNQQLGFVQNPVSVVPASGAVVGTTELRNDSHASNAPAQLTIFYAGSVSVYSNISPEKAQAIMLLAGNGTPNAFGPKPAASPAQGAVLPRLPIIDGFAVNRDNIRAACFSCPISITPYTIPQSAAGSGSSQEAPSAVPLARKASLARFLEKRKERVIRASPYANKHSPECDSLGSASITYPANSLSSFPLGAAN
ncbi:protein TIFY 6B-like isoform X3 [Ipomoea triloba]|uniref:protein TIFY 6B-like isoform X3 n=1 Tax=Ipomoea triloba TaxID=35885 RepID=UPI00125DA56A|nr:protein TIFY 6B-like isoform X3 [Ipomoea triloba]